MPRYKQTPRGLVQLSIEEEEARDAEEQAWADGANDRVAEANRFKRDALLTETDWWASSDLTITDEQRSYRQQLRDITDHANWPNLEDEDWPTKP